MGFTLEFVWFNDNLQEEGNIQVGVYLLCSASVLHYKPIIAIS